MRLILDAMATKGAGVWSVRWAATTLAVLSEKPQLLYRYFAVARADHQSPIDSIRGELVMSLENWATVRTSERSPAHAQLVNCSPIPSNADWRASGIQPRRSFSRRR